MSEAQWQKYLWILKVCKAVISSTWNEMKATKSNENDFLVLYLADTNWDIVKLRRAKCKTHRYGLALWANNILEENKFVLHFSTFDLFFFWFIQRKHSKDLTFSWIFSS